MLEVKGRGRMERIKLDYTNATDVVTEEALARPFTGSTVTIKSFQN